MVAEAALLDEPAVDVDVLFVTPDVLLADVSSSSPHPEQFGATSAMDRRRTAVTENTRTRRL